MTRAFIVRPFGLKEGVDFDAVEAALIQPALRKAGIQGSTTAEIVEQGNIREDMFRLLVTADLVVADLSIHNANVFYELGIRHGLRPSATFLLRADVHRYPFDLQTDRYLVYDASNPAAKAGDLARALAATVRSSRVDSPVYQILPNLRAPDPAVLRVVPSDFREDVGRAHAERWRGDLRLFAHEARDFEWASEGLRTVGRAQFDLGAHPGAKETFEWLLALVPDDVDAHQMLATIYQRLGDLTRSSQAVQRVIDAPAVRRRDRAEAFALRARNAKARLRSALAGKGSAEAREAALRAPQLGESFESYRAGFTQDLNHFYPGLNALALLCIRNELAKELPDVWSEQFDSDEDAKRARDAGLATFRQLAAAVELSLECSRRVVEHRADADPPRLWERISEADFAFLTGSRPKAVARRYREALDGAPSFAVGSVREQLELFEQLGVRKEFVSEALAVVRALDSGGTELAPAPRPKRVLLFSGHMVDAPGRTPPRFPRTAAAEAEARRMIRGAVENERSLEPGQVLGVAGGASGGDILFHEVCAELGVETALYLALPRDAYRARSVQHGGPRWVERYDRLCDRLPVRVFAADEELPRWLRGKPDYGFWHRSTLWLLFNALAVDAASLTLVALWDREDGDGPGGTGDLVSHVEERGHKTVLLDATELKKFTE
jgi:tetratricopeptide (TPR) repeat protein